MHLCAGNRCLPTWQLSPWLTEPFGNLFRIIFTATWFANVGIPTIVALSAILAAYLVLKKQISHDKDLVENERRRAKALTYAVSLRQAAQTLNSLAGELAQSTLSYTEQSRWMSTLSRLNGELGRSGFRLEDGLGHCPDLLSDVSAYKHSMTRRLQVWLLLAQEPGSENVPPEARARTCAYLLEVYAEFFDTTAGQLEDWGGELPVPPSGARLPSVPPEVHLPGGGTFMIVWPRKLALDPPPWSPSESRNKWMEEQQLTFASAAKQMAKQLSRF